MTTQPTPPTPAKPDPRPTTIVTETSEEFFRLCDRAERGELVIESLAMGKGNGQWVASVRYTTPSGDSSGSSRAQKNRV